MIAPALIVVVDVVVGGALAVTELELELAALAVAAQPEADPLVPRQIERRVEHLADARPPACTTESAGRRVDSAAAAFSGILRHRTEFLGDPNVGPSCLAGAYHERVEVILRIFQIGREGVEAFQKARLRGVVGAAGPGPGPAHHLQIDADPAGPLFDLHLPSVGLPIEGGDVAPRLVDHALQRTLFSLPDQVVILLHLAQAGEGRLGHLSAKPELLIGRDQVHDLVDVGMLPDVLRRRLQRDRGPVPQRLVQHVLEHIGGRVGVIDVVPADIEGHQVVAEPGEAGRALVQIALQIAMAIRRGVARDDMPGVVAVAARLKQHILVAEAIVERLVQLRVVVPVIALETLGAIPIHHVHLARVHHAGQVLGYLIDEARVHVIEEVAVGL